MNTYCSKLFGLVARSL
jgi:hypothetical protein